MEDKLSSMDPLLKEGIANIFSSCFGGMGGSNSITQSIVTNMDLTNTEGISLFITLTVTVLLILLSALGMQMLMLHCQSGLK